MKSDLDLGGASNGTAQASDTTWSDLIHGSIPKIPPDRFVPPDADQHHLPPEHPALTRARELSQESVDPPVEIDQADLDALLNTGDAGIQEIKRICTAHALATMGVAAVEHAIRSLDELVRDCQSDCLRLVEELALTDLGVEVTSKERNPFTLFDWLSAAASGLIYLAVLSASIAIAARTLSLSNFAPNWVIAVVLAVPLVGGTSVAKATFEHAHTDAERRSTLKISATALFILVVAFALLFATNFGHVVGPPPVVEEEPEFTLALPSATTESEPDGPDWDHRVRVLFVMTSMMVELAGGACAYITTAMILRKRRKYEYLKSGQRLALEGQLREIKAVADDADVLKGDLTGRHETIHNHAEIYATRGVNELLDYRAEREEKRQQANAYRRQTNPNPTEHHQ